MKHRIFKYLVVCFFLALGLVDMNAIPYSNTEKPSNIIRDLQQKIEQYKYLRIQYAGQESFYNEYTYKLARTYQSLGDVYIRVICISSSQYYYNFCEYYLHELAQKSNSYARLYLDSTLRNAAMLDELKKQYASEWQNMGCDDPDKAEQRLKMYQKKMESEQMKLIHHPLSTSIIG